MTLEDLYKWCLDEAGQCRREGGSDRRAAYFDAVAICVSVANACPFDFKTDQTTGILAQLRRALANLGP